MQCAVAGGCSAEVACQGGDDESGRCNDESEGHFCGWMIEGS